MNTRKRWHDSSSTTSYPNFYTKDETISDVQKNFDIRRYYSAEGYEVKIDGIVVQVIIQSHSNPLNEGKYDRKIHMPMDTVVQTGSYVEWENSKWLITSSIDNKEAYKTASMVKCTETLQIYKNNVLSKVPCVIGNNIYGSDTEDTKYLSTIAGQITVSVPNNPVTQQIKPDDKFKIGLRSYIALMPNDIIKQGLLVIPMNYSDTEQTLPTFSISITNGIEVSTNTNTPVQLLVNVYNGLDTNPVSPTPSLVFESSNTAIATVDSTGKVTPITEGMVTITCKLASDETVTKSINIIITSVAQNNYTYSLTSDISPISEVKQNKTKVFTIHKYNNGAEIIGQFDISVIGTSVPTTAYSLVVLSDNSFSLKTLQTTYVLKVRCTDRSDNTKYLEQDIKLRSVM